MLKPLEILYVLLGTAIIVHGSLTDSLTSTELMAGLALLGAVPVGRADRVRTDSPAGAVRRLIREWLDKGEAPK